MSEEESSEGKKSSTNPNHIFVIVPKGKGNEKTTRNADKPKELLSQPLVKLPEDNTSLDDDEVIIIEHTEMEVDEPIEMIPEEKPIREDVVEVEEAYGLTHQVITIKDEEEMQITENIIDIEPEHDPLLIEPEIDTLETKEVELITTDTTDVTSIEPESTQMISDNSVTTQDAIEQYVIEDSSDESDTDSDPLELRVGFMKEAFDILKETAIKNKKNAKPTLCGLLIGEMRLAEKYEKYKGKIFGYTEGMGQNSLHEPKKMASKAVMFMVVSMVDNWKIPIALFFVHNPDIKYFADTIEETLRRLQDNDINIISVTMNCISPHLSFALAEELGAEIDSSELITHFSHPSTGKSIFILYDVDILLSMFKSHWANEKTLYYKRKILDHSMCSKVSNMEKEDLYSYRPENVFDWVIIKKRLTYDTDNYLGKTMADAIQYLHDLGHPSFRNTKWTIQLIRIIDLISSIFKMKDSPDEIPHTFTKSNKDKWENTIVNINHYLKQLSSLSQGPVFDTYVTGIRVCLISLLELYREYVLIENTDDPESYTLPHLVPWRFGLRHIRIGLFENINDQKKFTALRVFLLMKSSTKSLHNIE